MSIENQVSDAFEERRNQLEDELKRATERKAELEERKSENKEGITEQAQEASKVAIKAEEKRLNAKLEQDIDASNNNIDKAVEEKQKESEAAQNKVKEAQEKIKDLSEKIAEAARDGSPDEVKLKAEREALKANLPELEKTALYAKAEAASAVLHQDKDKETAEKQLTEASKSDLAKFTQDQQVKEQNTIDGRTGLSEQSGASIIKGADLRIQEAQSKLDLLNKEQEHALKEAREADEARAKLEKTTKEKEGFSERNGSELADRTYDKELKGLNGTVVNGKDELEAALKKAGISPELFKKLEYSAEAHQGGAAKNTSTLRIGINGGMGF